MSKAKGKTRRVILQFDERSYLKLQTLRERGFKFINVILQNEKTNEVTTLIFPKIEVLE